MKKQILLTVFLLVVSICTVTVSAKEYFKAENVLYVHPEIIKSQGVNYKMYWVNMDWPAPKKVIDPTDIVRDVCFVPEGFEDTRSEFHNDIPPRLTKIIHNLPNKTTFIEALVEFRQGGIPYKMGIRLPDDVANLLMDLVEGKTKFKVKQGSMLNSTFSGSNMVQTTSADLTPKQYI